MDNKKFNDILKNDIEMVEKAIIDFLPEAKDGQAEVVEAMKYSLSNGGKDFALYFALNLQAALD